MKRHSKDKCIIAVWGEIYGRDVFGMQGILFIRGTVTGRPGHSGKRFIVF
jgi:hypothetical protein